MTAEVYDWRVDVFGQRRSQISDCAATVPCLLLVWFKGLQIPRRATICARLLHSQGVRCHRLPSQHCAYNVAFSLCHLVLYEHEYSVIFFFLREIISLTKCLVLVPCDAPKTMLFLLLFLKFICFTLRCAMFSTTRRPSCAVKLACWQCRENMQICRRGVPRGKRESTALVLSKPMIKLCIIFMLGACEL